MTSPNADPQRADAVVAAIDAAVDDAREEVCACGCNTALTPEGPSLYFAGEACQRSFIEQQHAHAAGRHDIAGQLRAHRAATCGAPVNRPWSQIRAEWEARLRLADQREAVAVWLRAQGIVPANVVEGAPIVTTATTVTVTEYVRNGDGCVAYVAGSWATQEHTYALVRPWPDGLEWPAHRHDPDSSRNGDAGEPDQDPAPCRVVAGSGTVQVAPIGTALDDPGWEDVGYIAGEPTFGADPASPDADPVVPSTDRSGFHRTTLALDLTGGSHAEWIARWRQLVTLYFGHVGHGLGRIGAHATGLRNQLRWPDTEAPAQDPMLRAIEAKKHRNTGPQANRRAPKRIDPNGRSR